MHSAPSPSIDDLSLASAVEQRSPGRFVLHVPDGWQQGRGAFGGILLAALARAVLGTEPEKDRKLRAFNAEIAGPVLTGEAEIEVTVLRRGSGLSSYDATLSQRGQGLVRASAVLARARGAAPSRLHVPSPSPRPWTEIEPISTELAGAAVPVFVRHMEMRPLGPLPFSGGGEPVASGWVRPRRTLASLDAPEIIALADAWWPAVLAISPVPRPVGTVAFALQYFPPDPALDPSVPLHYRGSVLAEQDGYMMESRELWSEDGRLVALNQQTIAWIR